MQPIASNFKIKSQGGFGVLEILIALLIISLALVSLTSLANFAAQATTKQKDKLVANYLAVELLETARAIKEEGWTSLNSYALSTPYHPEKSGVPAKWILAFGTDSWQGFERELTLNSVYRDGDDNIVDSGGTLDPNTLKITAKISWNERGQAQELFLITYLSDWQP